MSFYSEEFINRITDANDIVDVIGGYVRLEKRGSRYVGLCPFHGEKTPSFYVTPSKGLYHCFGCKESGNVITFIRKQENYSFFEAVEFLADRAGIEVPKQELSEEEKKAKDERAQILEINKLVAEYYYYGLREEAGKNAYAYLKKRALSDQIMKQFGLGFAKTSRNTLYQYIKGKGYKDDIILKSGLFNHSEKDGMYDKFWNRVIFPIMDVNSKVIGFGGRVMDAGEPKYLNSPETMVFNKSRNLYGMNIARTSKKDYLILCEGYMDVIAMHQAGFNNACASLGTAFTEGQAKLISKYVKSVYLAYDSDTAGQKAIERAEGILRGAGISAKVINLKPYKDPDEFIKNLGSDEFNKRIENAENAFMYILRSISAGYNLEDPSDVTAFQKECAKRLALIEDNMERANFEQAVAREFYIKPSNLEEKVNKYGNDLKYNRQKEEYSAEYKRTRQTSAKQNQSQYHLLYMISENTGIYEIVKEFIEPSDFADPLCREVAKKLFKQIEEQKVNVNSIVNSFSEKEEEQRLVSEIFNFAFTKEDMETDGEPETEKDKSVKEKTLKDLVYRVKLSGLEAYKNGDGPKDAGFANTIRNAKFALEKIKKTDFRI